MQKEKIILRRATKKDIPAILEVEKDLLSTKIYSGLTSSKEAEKEMENEIYYVIEEGSRVVGDISYRMENENHAYISGVAVAKDFQGKGIARQATMLLLEIIGNVEIIDLATHSENYKAINLYKSLGFKQIGEPMENYFDDGEPRIRMVLER